MKETNELIETLLCSNCFKNQGLKIDAARIGIEQQGICPNCKAIDGRKLDAKLIESLAYRFFVRGTIHKCNYGAAPLIQFNKHQYSEDICISDSEWLVTDIKTIQNAIKIGFFHYGPRMWMLGDVEPLQSLLKKTERELIINRIMNEYPEKIITPNEFFYRLRKAPNSPSSHNEYDSPPVSNLGRGRFDAKDFPVLYASQDIEVCVHECRVTIDDDLYLATIKPNRDLRLLDLTELIDEDTTEFESLDMTILMLFLAGKYSYKISREIARSAAAKGFDGIIYPSYFSLVRTGSTPFPTVYGISVRRFPNAKQYIQNNTIENIVLFGRPIMEELVSIICINKLLINQVAYDLLFGPVDF